MYHRILEISLAILSAIMRASILICSLSPYAIALAAIVPKAQAPGGLAEGSFASPTVAVQPKFRYW